MRRDLTINALYYNISTDEVCDFTKMGLDDIKNHVIRTTGDANMIFDDDPLRILRVVRFATRLGWGIEKNTWAGMIMNSKRVSILSQERVTEELNKMLMGDNPSEAIRKLDRCNVLHRVFPSLTASKHVYQDLRPLRTVYEHVLETLDKTPKVLETRLAALLHDIGKLKTFDKNFMYHSQIGADMAEEVMKAMKYSNATIATVKKAIEVHEDFSSYITGNVPRPAIIRKFVVKFNGNDKDLDVALDLIHANNITQMYGKKIKLVPGIRRKIEELDRQSKNQSGKKLTIPINGKDIMAEFNIKAGPTLGVIMNEVKKKVIENPDVTKEELFKYVEEYIKKVV
jgi:putative nucleotidyltransferase with HDIG domain